MGKSPKLNHKTASAAEMDKLLADNPDCQKILNECTIATVDVTENLPPVLVKQTISIFRHPDSQDNMAIITDNEKSDGSKYSVISMLRVQDTVYQCDLPY